MTDKGTVVSLFLFSSLLDSVPSFVHPSPCFRPSSAPVTVPAGFCSALPPLSRFDAAPARGWFLQPALRLLFVFESLRSALGASRGLSEPHGTLPRLPGRFRTRRRGARISMALRGLRCGFAVRAALRSASTRFAAQSASKRFERRSRSLLRVSVQII